MRRTQLQIEGTVRDPCRMFENGSILCHEFFTRHRRRPRSVCADAFSPNAGQFRSGVETRHPLWDPALVEKTLQPWRDLGPDARSDGSADRSRTSWRAPFAFGVKRVKTVLQILEKLLALDVAWRGGKAHVVGFKRIGNDKLIPRAHLAPIGQIIIIGIGNPVELTALLLRSTVLTEQRPVYQPWGGSPTTSVCSRIASAHLGGVPFPRTACRDARPISGRGSRFPNRPASSPPPVRDFGQGPWRPRRSSPEYPCR